MYNGNNDCYGVKTIQPRWEYSDNVFIDPDNDGPIEAYQGPGYIVKIDTNDLSELYENHIGENLILRFEYPGFFGMDTVRFIRNT